MKKCDLDSKDCPTENSDFLSAIPWKQMGYFWSLRDCMSSWCHFEGCLSHSLDKVTQVEAQSWHSTVIPQPDPALSCHTANCHKKEAQHLALSDMRGLVITLSYQDCWNTAVPAGARVSPLFLLGTHLNKVPFDRYWENKISWSAGLQQGWKQRSRRQTCQEIMWNQFLWYVCYLCLKHCGSTDRLFHRRRRDAA